METLICFCHLKCQDINQDLSSRVLECLYNISWQTTQNFSRYLTLDQGLRQTREYYFCATINSQTLLTEMPLLCTVCSQQHTTFLFLKNPPAHCSPQEFVIPLLVSQDRNRISGSSSGLTQIHERPLQSRELGGRCVWHCNITASEENKPR